jgi:anti-sigma B factor antagonist
LAISAINRCDSIALVSSVQDQLLIEVRRQNQTAVLRLQGELDLVSAPLLESELESAEIETATVVVLDLQELRFIDSTGLRVLLAAHQRAHERGQQFAITPGSEQVQRLLSITRVDEHLRVISSPDELLT